MIGPAVAMTDADWPGHVAEGGDYCIIKLIGQRQLCSVVGLVHYIYPIIHSFPLPLSIFISFFSLISSLLSSFFVNVNGELQMAFLNVICDCG